MIIFVLKKLGKQKQKGHIEYFSGPNLHLFSSKSITYTYDCDV